MISVVSKKDKWMQIITSMDNYDSYHTYDYHHISKNSGEVPILIVYQEDDKILAIPFLKLSICDTPYFDLISVYGYAGPVSKNIGVNFDNSRFMLEFKNILKDLNIVSVFSRLHPYMDNQLNILRNLGKISALGKVVNIDLEQHLNVQRHQYSKSTKNRVNKCRRLCSVRTASTKSDLLSFIDIYYENMDRVNASEKYYFTKEYFFEFLESADFKTEILLITDNDTQQDIAGAMFIKTKSIVQYHLSGTRTKFLNLAPANLFLDEMRIKASLEGYKSLNLGGGFGGQLDSLFKFKSSFSKDCKSFNIWKYIADNQQYQSLVKKNVSTENPNFFPLYRAFSVSLWAGEILCQELF